MRPAARSRGVGPTVYRQRLGDADALHPFSRWSGPGRTPGATLESSPDGLTPPAIAGRQRATRDTSAPDPFPTPLIAYPGIPSAGSTVSTASAGAVLVGLRRREKLALGPEGRRRLGRVVVGQSITHRRKSSGATFPPHRTVAMCLPR